MRLPRALLTQPRPDGAAGQPTLPLSRSALQSGTTRRAERRRRGSTRRRVQQFAVVGVQVGALVAFVVADSHTPDGRTTPGASPGGRPAQGPATPPGTSPGTALTMADGSQSLTGAITPGLIPASSPLDLTTPALGNHPRTSLLAPHVPTTLRPAGSGGSGGSGNGYVVPTRAKTAYVAAAQRMATLDPACRIPWALLAAIGRVESDHGRAGGSTLTAAGRATPPIYGPRRDGSVAGVGVLHDTDHGALDGDASYDRAVGPMQLLPATWRAYALDADHDHVADPQDVDDAALTAAHYLCTTRPTAQGSVATPLGEWTAAYRYHHATSYANLVLALATTYATGHVTPLQAPPAGALAAIAAPSSSQTATTTPTTATTTSGPTTTSTSTTSTSTTSTTGTDSTATTTVTVTVTAPTSSTTDTPASTTDAGTVPDQTSQQTSQQTDQTSQTSNEQVARQQTGTTTSTTTTSTATSTGGTPSVPAATGFHGWASGASGDGVTDGAFGTWRGSPVTVSGTWDDTDAATQATLPTLAQFAGWKDDLDVAVGGTVLGSGESYAQAAAGAYLTRWTQMAQTLQRLRGNQPGITYVRPFHEFNGDWYAAWQVTPANLADYKTAFRLMAQTVRANCPRCKIVWSPNNGTATGSASPLDAYPGDDVVDVVGIDSYNANGNTVVTSAQAWNDYATATSNGVPVGVEAWRGFAEQHGKPMSLPEWGLNSGAGGGDNPAYIQGMHDWITQHAAQPGDPNVAGKIVYDVYFNIAMGGNSGFLITGGSNPNAARTYLSLHWGNVDPAAITAIP